MKRTFAIALTTVTLGLALLTGSASAAHLNGLTVDDCKNGGFAEYQRTRRDASTTFRNQGDCIQFVNTGK